MGSSISPIVANLYMENFEVEAINTAPHTPYLWKKYEDDTFAIIKSSQRRDFLDHINSIDKHIQFTSEDQREDGSMPFLDILIILNDDGSLSTAVYRKPTHTDLYLQWDSHHTIPFKYSVIGTLHHRAQTICSNPQQLQQEENHLYRALTKCKYPAWALNRINIKIRNPVQNKNRSNKTNSGTNNNQNPYTVVPYHRGLSESLKKVCRKHGEQVYFKGGTIIKNLLMAPKDQDPIQKESGVIYRYNCGRGCDEEYIGESSWPIGVRFREHLKAPSPIFDHHNVTGHNVTIDNFNIVGRKD